MDDSLLSHDIVNFLKSYSLGTVQYKIKLVPGLRTCAFITIVSGISIKADSTLGQTGDDE